MKRSFIRQILESIDKDTISFAGGLPDEDLFPMKDLQRAAKKAFKDKKNLQYALSNGIKPLREKIAKFYNDEGFETDIDNLLITTGSQQAMYIIAKYFAKKDIIVENPSYLGALNILRSNDCNVYSLSRSSGFDVTNKEMIVDFFQKHHVDFSSAFPCECYHVFGDEDGDYVVDTQEH